MQCECPIKKQGVITINVLFISKLALMCIFGVVMQQLGVTLHFGLHV